MDQADVLLSKLQDDIQTALQLWHSPDPDSTPLDWLQLFQQTRQETSTNREATNKILLAVLDTLALNRADDVDWLRQHFLDGQKIKLLARTRNISESTAYRRKDDAIKQLAAILWTKEIEAKERIQSRLLARLEPMPQVQMIGIEAHLNRLSKILLSPDDPWLVSIEGLGGLGKTSMADALARQLIKDNHLDDLGWISARTRQLNPGGAIKAIASPILTAEGLIEKLVTQLIPDARPQDWLSFEGALTILRRKLRRGRHLIVIDNLETLQDIESLLPFLRDLSNPAKFLLTSRQSLKDEPDIFPFPLPELSETHTLQLIRYQAELRNLEHLNRAADDELKKIYETVGGNPLAVLLVIGQTHHYTLDEILEGLTQKKGQEAANLYTYIFQQAWEALGDEDRKILIAMPLVFTNKGTLNHLRKLTNVDETTLRRSLDILIKLRHSSPDSHIP